MTKTLEKKIELKSIDEVSVDYFNQFKYHELKKEFERLGVKEAFEMGAKKEQLIKDALTQIAVVKANSPKSDFVKVNEVVTEAKVESKKGLLKADDKKDILVKRLEVIKKNLKQAIPSHREILSVQQEEVEKELLKYA